MKPIKGVYIRNYKRIQLHNYNIMYIRIAQECEENFNLILSISARHPRLMQPMRMIDLLYFVAEHDDHH